MCPMCWAAALASFATLVAMSVVMVAGNDRWCLAAALTLAIAVMLQRTGGWAAPTWCIVALNAAAAGRLIYLLVVRSDELLVCKSWSRACKFAANRCPNQGRLRTDVTTPND